MPLEATFATLRTEWNTVGPFAVKQAVPLRLARSTQEQPPGSLASVFQDPGQSSVNGFSGPASGVSSPNVDTFLPFIFPEQKRRTGAGRRDAREQSALV